MTAVICLGGPWHGQFVDPEGRHTVKVEYIDAREAKKWLLLELKRDHLIEQGFAPDQLLKPIKPSVRTLTYHLRSIQIVGWRIVLNCLTTWDVDAPAPDGCVMPGYVHGVPAECEPDHNARPLICRCALMNLAASLRLMTGRGVSSCHLDYCPAHGPFRTKESKHDHGW